MSGKQMRVIAAAILFSAPALLLCFARPLRILAAGPQAPGQNAPSASRNPYQPAAVLSAADVPFPFETTADGVVAFSVPLGAGGEVGKISVLQDLPPFTAAAEDSLKHWKFSPASMNNSPEDSQMLVAFVFRHAVYIANPPPFTPIVPAKESADARRGFVPPGILSVAYAGYPASTIAFGAVVVQANVRADGSTGGVSIIRDLQGGFGPLAINAAKHWRFQPAMRDGRAVPSKVTIAFVFSSRSLNPF
jgi:hypothetical protein